MVTLYQTAFVMGYNIVYTLMHKSMAYNWCQQVGGRS